MWLYLLTQQTTKTEKEDDRNKKQKTKIQNKIK
jgi:hypothetical protein